MQNDSNIEFIGFNDILITRFADAKSTLGTTQTLRQCVDYIKDSKLHAGRINELRPLYAEAERLRLIAEREGTADSRADYLAAKEKYDEPKRRLPAFTASGTFKQRKIAGLDTYSGLLQADFDHLRSKGVDLADLRARAELDPHILFSCVSPSGDGFKMFFRVDSGPDDHTAAFVAMQRYCVSIYGIEPDGACKDVSRLCYYPADPDLYANENAVMLDWRAWPEPEIVEEDDEASELPLDALPEIMQRLATACAEVYQVDVALPAVSALAVLSAALGGSVRCAGAANGRETPCNIFLAAGAPSGYGKSVCGFVAEPLMDASHKLGEEWLNVTRPQCLVDIAVAEQDRKALLLEMRDADSTKRALARAKLVPLEASIARWTLESSVCPTLYTGSSTGAALVEAMLRNGEQIFSLALEAGDAIRVMGGRYTADTKGDYDLVLSAFSGEPFAQSRKGSGQVNLKAPCMSILWSVPPMLLRELYGTPEAQERGLLARFNVIRCDDDICPLDDGVFREVPPAVTAEWRSLILAALALRRTGRNIVFQADREARELFRNWHNEAVKLRNGAGRESEAKLKRCRENAIRIATGIAAAEWLKAGQPGGDKPPLTVEHAAKGIAIARYFLAETLSLTRGAVVEKQRTQVAELSGIVAQAGGAISLRELRRCHGYGEAQLAQIAATSKGALKVRVTRSTTI